MQFNEMETIRILSPSSPSRSSPQSKPPLVVSSSASQPPLATSALSVAASLLPSSLSSFARNSRLSHHYHPLSSGSPPSTADSESKSLLASMKKNCPTKASSMSSSSSTLQSLLSSSASSISSGKTHPLPPPTFCSSRLGYLIHSTSICAAYLLTTQLLIRLSGEHILLVLVFLALYNGPSSARKFITSFSIFIVYWIIFDYMKALPNYRVRSVSIKELYDAEKSAFGFCYGGHRITHNEFWFMHSNPLLTLISGLFYLMWIPLPLSFAAYLYAYKSTRKFYFQFAFNFLFLNLLGFMVYYIFPAAPPWYVQEHGLNFDPDTLPSSGRLQEFDNIIGVPLFKLIYSKSSNIFATMPSLHVSYPCLVLLYGLKIRLHPAANAAFSIAFCGISFAAVYTSHHYVLDVLAGLLTAIICFLVFQFVLLKVCFANKNFK